MLIDTSMDHWDSGNCGQSLRPSVGIALKATWTYIIDMGKRQRDQWIVVHRRPLVAHPFLSVQRVKLHVQYLRKEPEQLLLYLQLAPQKKAAREAANVWRSYTHQTISGVEESIWNFL